MKFLKGFDPKKLLSLFENRQSLIGIVIVTVILGAVYILGKQEDNRIVTYHNQAQPDFSGGRVLSSNTSIYEKKDRIITDKLEELEAKIKSLTELVEEEKNELVSLKEIQTKEKDQVHEPTTHAISRIEAPPIVNEPTADSDNKIPSSVPIIQEVPLARTLPSSVLPPNGPSIISFPVKEKAQKADMAVTLPSGSFVKAKLLTGVEAPEGKALPVLLQADFAFIGPNKSKVDLSGCFLIAKSTGNLSIERVEMQTTKISCVAKSGRMFERELSGFVADSKDNSFAVIGDVNSKQDRVAAMAFLSSIVEGIGSAIAHAQTSTVSGDNGGARLTISGDQQRYIAASGVSNAASAVTQWYLKHAENLLPTINIGSGQDLWIVVQESVELPNWYFKKTTTDRGEFSFLSKLVD